MTCSSPPAEAADGERTVIFLHVGKTGGSTLQQIIYRNHAASEVMHVRATARGERPARESSLRGFAALPEQERGAPRVIEGHTIFGLHRFVPRPSTYLTLLRDPVALSISQYRYVLRTPTHPLHAVGQRLGSLDSYVRSGVSLETDNSQVRAITGDTVTPFGGVTSEMLDRAIEHLEKWFSLAGITEDFDASLVLMRRIFGWSRLHYVRVNTAPGTRRSRPVEASTIAYLRKQNRFDAELHAWARARLSAATDDDGFRDELRRFRRHNALYRPWGQLTYRAPRRLRDAGLSWTRSIRPQ